METLALQEVGLAGAVWHEGCPSNSAEATGATGEVDYKGRRSLQMPDPLASGEMQNPNGKGRLT